MAVIQRPISPIEAALVAQACTKSELIWLRPLPQNGHEERFRAAWHVWHDDAVCVITGPGEQNLPELGGGGATAELIARSKDNGTQVVRFLARVEPVPAHSRPWQAAADALIAARLNTHHPETHQAEWAKSATILLLRPVTVTEAVAGDDRTPSGRVTPPEGPGTTLTRRPFHLGGRIRRARRRAAG